MRQQITITHAAAGDCMATHSGQSRIGGCRLESSTQTRKGHEDHHGIGKNGRVGPKTRKNEQHDAYGVRNFPAAAEVEADYGIGLESVTRDDELGALKDFKV
jgi:hypothetical protein